MSDVLNEDNKIEAPLVRRSEPEAKSESLFLKDYENFAELMQEYGADSEDVDFKGLDFSREGIANTLKSLEDDPHERKDRHSTKGGKGLLGTLLKAMGEAIKSVYLEWPKLVFAGTGAAIFGAIERVTLDLNLKKHGADRQYPNSLAAFFSDTFSKAFKSSRGEFFKPLNTITSSMYDFSFNKAEGKLTISSQIEKTYGPGPGPGAPLSAEQEFRSSGRDGSIMGG